MKGNMDELSMPEYYVGNRVIYVNGYGDSTQNPLYNGKYGRIVGTIDDNSGKWGLRYHVKWDNGEINTYESENLLPEPKPIYKLDDSLFEV